MQRMALATLSVDEGYGFPLIRALAQVGDLLPEARTFLANHEETWLRQLVWSRGDARQPTSSQQPCAGVNGVLRSWWRYVELPTSTPSPSR